MNAENEHNEETIDLVAEIHKKDDHDKVVTATPNEHAAAGDEHGQPFEIIINAEGVDVTKKELTFRELCLLAFPDGQFGDTVAWTVTYSDPHGPEGSMVDGDSIKVKKGMVFNVGRSDKS